MMQLPAACVVDASVGIRLFVAEEYSEDVQEFFSRALAGPAPSILVSDLFFIECANVLWKKVRRGEYSYDDARSSLAELRALQLPTVGTAELMERALDIASELNISAYDACYLALAELAGLPLLTADARLSAALPADPCSVVLLGEDV